MAGSIPGLIDENLQCINSQIIQSNFSELRPWGVHIASKSLCGKFSFAFTSSRYLEMMTDTDLYKRDKFSEL